MIEFKNVHKSFKGQKVLKGLNLKLPEGKITVIIGRSGEGKSVLLKHIMMLIKPDSGQILVDGQDLSQLDEEGLKKARQKFGMLFQNAALFDSLNVFDNVAFPLIEHLNLPENEVKERVAEVLKQVNLKDIEHKMPSELSGGMRKRVGLARAVVMKPDIMLYDEPTTGLDPIMTDAIDQLILSTQKQLGITSVVISHDIGATFKIADKVAMLHEGKILLEGDEKTFRSSDNPFVQRFLEGRADAGEV